MGCGDGQGPTRWAGTECRHRVGSAIPGDPERGYPDTTGLNHRDCLEAQPWGVAWETRRQGAPGPGVLLCACSLAV